MKSVIKWTSKDGKAIKYYNNCKEAAEDTGYKFNTINTLVRSGLSNKYGETYERIPYTQYKKETKKYDKIEEKETIEHWLWSNETLEREKKIRQKIENERIRKYGR